VNRPRRLGRFITRRRRMQLRGDPELVFGDAERTRYGETRKRSVGAAERRHLRTSSSAVFLQKYKGCYRKMTFLNTTPSASAGGRRRMSQGDRWGWPRMRQRNRGTRGACWILPKGRAGGYNCKKQDTLAGERHDAVFCVTSFTGGGRTRSAGGCSGIIIQKLSL